MKKYILNGEVPVPEEDAIKWAIWFESANRIVNRTEIDSDEEVSTVFLGLDHQFVDGPPLLFQTTVFGGKLDREQARYSTWEQAVSGHNLMVEKVMSAQG